MAIYHINGREISVRTPEEERKILEEKLKNLTEGERRVVKAIVADVLSNKDPEHKTIKDVLEAIEYERKPVPLQEFLFSDYFIGSAGRRLYPKLVDDLFELFEGKYYLAIMGGAIGYGKSFFSAVALIRLLYLISCMRSPQVSYGLVEGSVISIVNMSVTLKLAQKVVFETIGNILRESPYFNDIFKFEQTQSELRFPKNIWIAPVTSADTSVLGLNVAAGCMDECVTGDTKVMLSDGSEIDIELMANDSFYKEILCYNVDTGELVPESEFFIKEKPVTDIFNVQLYDGKTIKATANHKLLVERDGKRGFVEIQDLEINDKVVVYRPCFGQNLTKVKSIDWMGKKKVFDLSTPHFKTFIANGIVVHNTNFLDYNPQNRQKSQIATGYYSRAESLFNAIMRRMKSRYMQVGGGVPGILFVLSSERTPEDFTKQLIRDLRDDPGVFVRQYALYDVKPIFRNSKKFFVLVGDDRVQPKIIEDKKEAEAFKKNGGYVIEVPEEFKRDFEVDIHSALREIAGIATSTVHPFIPNREKIDEMVDYSRVHPFSVYEWDTQQPADFLWSYLVAKKDGVYKPLVNPNAVRHIHIDLGLKKDAVGFCCAHIAGMKQVIRRDPSQMKEIIEVAPMIYVDFILRIVPPHLGEILIADVRSLIYQLLEHGFNIRYVSMDSWESADTLQQLRQRGIMAEVVSVDATTVPYETLKAAIYDGRVNVYKYDILLKELRELEKNVVKKKIDHPANGSKDCADALAGCVYTLLNKRGEMETFSPSSILIPDKKIVTENLWGVPVLPRNELPDDSDDDNWYDVKGFAGW